MARRGRKPKPIEAHKREGTFNATKHAGKGVPSGAGVIPDAPKHLNGDQRRVWDELVGALAHAAEVLALADAQTLEGAVIALWEARECRKQVQKDGMFIPTAYGIRAHPGLGAGNTAWKRFAAFAAELGMTPTARARFALPASDRAVTDTIDAHLNALPGGKEEAPEQCQAQTKSGKACTRRANHGGFCGQHAPAAG